MRNKDESIITMSIQERFGFIDTDSHILEPSDIWERYLEPKFRSEMTRSRAGYTGDPLEWRLEVNVGDHTMPFDRQFADTPLTIPFLESSYGDYVREKFSPKAYVAAMDRAQIDYMVVYP